MQAESQEQQLLAFAQEEFSVAPEYLFESSPDAAILRRRDNRKWFALFMTISAVKLGCRYDEPIRILNVKADPNLIGSLRLCDGFYPAYHMNKENWITIALEGSVAFDQIAQLLTMSYDLTGKKKTAKRAKKPDRLV